MIIETRLNQRPGMHTHVKSPLFAKEISQIAREQGITPLEVSRRIEGACYDHVRRVMKGEAFPSLGILEAILSVLGVSHRLEEFKNLILQDKGTYKGYTGAALNKDQYFMTLNTMWNDLDEGAKIDIVNYVASHHREAVSERRYTGTY